LDDDDCVEGDEAIVINSNRILCWLQSLATAMKDVGEYGWEMMRVYRADNESTDDEDDEIGRDIDKHTEWQWSWREMNKSKVNRQWK
jgi:hypothetical protein